MPPSEGEQPGAAVSSTIRAGSHIPTVSPGCGTPALSGQAHSGWLEAPAGTGPPPIGIPAMRTGNRQAQQISVISLPEKSWASGQPGSEAWAAGAAIRRGKPPTARRSDRTATARRGHAGPGHQRASGPRSGGTSRTSEHPPLRLDRGRDPLQGEARAHVGGEQIHRLVQAVLDGAQAVPAPGAVEPGRQIERTRPPGGLAQTAGRFDLVRIGRIEDDQALRKGQMLQRIDRLPGPDERGAVRQDEVRAGRHGGVDGALAGLRRGRAGSRTRRVASSDRSPPRAGRPDRVPRGAVAAPRSGRAR